MKSAILLNKVRIRRVARTRAKIFGTATRPRLTVFRSNRAMFVQLIDDAKGVTLASVALAELQKEEQKKTKLEQARLLGQRIAEKAKQKGITAAVFDRRSYQFHGRVKSVADGAREGGMQF